MSDDIMKAINEAEAEAEVEVAIQRTVSTANRRTAELGVEAPAATTIHPPRATMAQWIHHTLLVRIRYNTVIVFAAVSAPFPYIAIHIIKPKFVRFLHSYRMGGVFIVI